MQPRCMWFFPQEMGAPGQAAQSWGQEGPENREGGRGSQSGGCPLWHQNQLFTFENAMSCFPPFLGSLKLGGSLTYPFADLILALPTYPHSSGIEL